MKQILCLLWFSFNLLFAMAQEGSVPVYFRFFPVNSQVFIDGIPHKPQVIKDELRGFFLSPGAHHIRFEARGFESTTFPLLPVEGEVIEGKQERLGLPISLEGELPTAHQPKSVTFSPDGSFLAVASLGSTRGLQIFNVEPFTHVVDLTPPQEKGEEETGFVESAWLLGRQEVWVSQMDTGQFHVFDTGDWSLKGTFDTGGIWSKVILISDDESLAYISHWESNSVTEIDVESRQVLRTFPVSGTPRGLSFSPDGATLYVTIFTSNALNLIELASGKVSSQSYGSEGGAMRHIVPDRERGLFYVTNMLTGKVYAISDKTGAVETTYSVGSNPNTAEMSPDGRYLFVSCRGRNNPYSYLYEGPEYGKVYVIDCQQKRVLGWIWGRDQTTGLDVSPDSTYLAFTDFKDDNLELYRIERGE